MVVILPRYVPHWPYPDNPSIREGKKTRPDLGAPMPPLPLLQTHGRPMSAATVRSGPGYLEVPFVATQEHKRGRGHCRCAGRGCARARACAVARAAAALVGRVRPGSNARACGARYARAPRQQRYPTRCPMRPQQATHRVSPAGASWRP